MARGTLLVESGGSSSGSSGRSSLEERVHRPPLPKEEFREARRNLVAFWLLGLLNNSAYVIMIAGANEISAGSVGLVYFCAVCPTLVVKLTAPYWFHLVSYGTRMWAIGVLMSASYVTVALSVTRPWQLLGVVFGALQSGLGEASCLALCSHYDSRRALTFWSSGTGFAGVAGYSWVAGLHSFGGLSFRTTLLSANMSAGVWLLVYYAILDRSRQRRPPPDKPADVQLKLGDLVTAAAEAGGDVEVLDGDAERRQLLGGSMSPNGGYNMAADTEPVSPTGKQRRMRQMGWRERYERTLALWPYMVPLTVVYFAEYVMQSGTWTAIGFPLHDTAARHRFYEASNWCYQLGVFASRSSGMVYQADRRALWVMPGLQLALLAFFIAVALLHICYSWWLLLACITTGLLGGAVYVNAFTLIARQVDPGYREFSLAAASLADSLGVAAADIAGVLLQGCLFRYNRLPGADFGCGG